MGSEMCIRDRLDTLGSFEAINVGTGEGVSVLQMLQEFELQSGRSVSYHVAPRRPGDAPEVWANADKAFNKLKFKAKRGIAEMCKDTWHWQCTNPAGYSGQ